jgi:hypothetical protein
MIRRLSDIPAEARRLASAGMTRGRNWTLPQIVEHLARTFDWSTGRMPREERLSGRTTFKQFIGRVVVFATGRLPENVGTSQRVVATPDTTLEEALEHLVRAIADFETASELAPYHPVLGRMSRNDWRRFHLIHARHHLRRVEQRRVVSE